MCNREEYFDDGFNEITETNTDKMLKAITTISNNQKELEQKLEQRIAPKNEPLSPQNKTQLIFLHHIIHSKFINKVIDKISAPKTKIIDQIIPNISLVIANFSQNIGPSNNTPLVLIITESLDRNLMPLVRFIITNSHKLVIIGPNLQIVPHLFTHLMLIDLFIGSQQKYPSKPS